MSTKAIRNGKGKAAYKRKREQLKRRVAIEDLPCWLCGETFDLTLPAGHRLSFTADHVEALANGGHLSRSEIRPAHMACNASRGNHAEVEIWAAS